ncbi:MULTISPECIES: anti-sigma factor family protein [Burkholderia]|uniref:anti-sigma factor family protein n=1 Tax=Burkholderia TaxID=32008 RepID=UPI00075AD03C|nr:MULTISPECIES: anti-sigma factor [Burkholderia]KVM65545.1 transcriptional regulator [Burkholderia gladioli]MDN7807855.1 anti-sigma factor [Burkholderia gladioli]NBI48824.1 anti-sigma factor [Burkholderia sp. ISTR5]
MNDQATPITESELHAYVDGTLDEARRAHIDRLLETDHALADRIGDYFSINTLLHERYDRVLDEPLPARLLPPEDFAPEARQGEAGGPAPGAGVAAAPAVSAVPGAARPAANWKRFAGLAAALVLGIGIGAGGVLSPVGRGVLGGDGSGEGGGSIIHASYSGEALARQSAIAYVTYAPMVTRPVEVGADREQELVQWLSSRLGTDVRPPVLTHAGYELMGGRLLPGDDGPIAQFMYHNALGERITLNISHRKLSSDVTAFKLYQSGPVNVFYWIDGRFGYAVSGGMDRQALLDLSHEVYEQLTANGGPQPAK